MYLESDEVFMRQYSLSSIFTVRLSVNLNQALSQMLSSTATVTMNINFDDRIETIFLIIFVTLSIGSIFVTETINFENSTESKLDIKSNIWVFHYWMFFFWLRQARRAHDQMKKCSHPLKAHYSLSEYSLNNSCAFKGWLHFSLEWAVLAGWISWLWVLKRKPLHLQTHNSRS